MQSIASPVARLPVFCGAFIVAAAPALNVLPVISNTRFVTAFFGAFAR